MIGFPFSRLKFLAQKSNKFSKLVRKLTHRPKGSPKRISGVNLCIRKKSDVLAKIFSRVKIKCIASLYPPPTVSSTQLLCSETQIIFLVKLYNKTQSLIVSGSKKQSAGKLLALVQRPQLETILWLR